MRASVRPQPHKFMALVLGRFLLDPVGQSGLFLLMRPAFGGLVVVGSP